MKSRVRAEDPPVPKLGLRERKKAETRLAISKVATALFIERGFDRVTLAEVAEAANVSINTIFNYFTTKEDLFFDRAEEVVDALSRMVRERRADETTLDALRRGFLDAIQGGNLYFANGKQVRRFLAAVEASPSLKARELRFAVESEQRLATTLIHEMGATSGDPTPLVLAAMIGALANAVLRDLRARMFANESEARSRAAATKLIERGFDILRAGAHAKATKSK
jgi:AcrR family transcriptional regulator